MKTLLAEALLAVRKELQKYKNYKDYSKAALAVDNAILIVRILTEEQTMSDYASARAAGIAAIDELDLWQGQPTLTSQLASTSALQAQITTLQGQVTTVTGERDARQTAITAMKAAANADKTADAANVAGQGVLDAAGSF